MKISETGLQVIKHFEGLKNKPYLCPAKLWTVGFGHVLYQQQLKLKLADRPNFLLNPNDDRIWSNDECNDLLLKELAHFEAGVLRLCPSVLNHQGRFDALVAFSYNVGLGNLQASTLRSKLNRGDLEGAGEEFLKWNKGGGRVLPGLTKRRMAEQALFLK